MHDLVEPEAVLGAVGLLRYCSARHLARIGALAAPLEVGAATVVVAAGARNVPLVLVLGGVGRVEGHDGDAFWIGPGAHLGGDTLLDGGPAPWTVTALTGMRLAVIERRNFVELLVAAPVIARRVLVAARQDPRGAGGSSGTLTSGRDKVAGWFTTATAGPVQQLRPLDTSRRATDR